MKSSRALWISDQIFQKMVDEAEKYAPYETGGVFMGYTVAQIFKSSGGSITYLGDWHTHPNSKPMLSMLDRRTLTRIALTPESQTSYPVMAILGSSPNKWAINIVQFVSGAMRPWPFSKCIYDNILCEIYKK